MTVHRDDESFTQGLSSPTQREPHKMTPWFSSLITLFSPTRLSPNRFSPTSTADNTTPHFPGAGLRPQHSSSSSADLKAISLPKVLTLTHETHCDLNHSLDQLLNALRSHAISLFRIRILKQTEIWELNKMLTQLLDFVKHLMPLQAIPLSHLDDFTNHFQTLSGMYHSLLTKYDKHEQAHSLVSDWTEKVVGRIQDLNAFFDVLRHKQHVQLQSMTTVMNPSTTPVTKLQQTSFQPQTTFKPINNSLQVASRHNQSLALGRDANPDTHKHFTK